MKPCPLIPVGNKVVIRRMQQKEVSTGGIFIPDEARDKNPTGEVQAVGNGGFNNKTQKFERVDVKVGDVVMFEEHAGTDVKVNGVWYTILRGGEIHSILN